jgi:hypothetical protein
MHKDCGKRRTLDVNLGAFVTQCQCAREAGKGQEVQVSHEAKPSQPPRPRVMQGRPVQANLKRSEGRRDPRLRPSWATGAQVEEKRYPLPTATAVRLDHTIRNLRFSQGLDEQAGFLERQKITFNRSMLAVKCHGQPVPLDRIGVVKRSEVASLDHEGRGLFAGSRLKSPRRIERVNDCHAETPPGLENACGFPHGSRHGVHIVKRHEGDRQVSARIVEGKSGSVGKANIQGRIKPASGSNQ